MHIPYAARKGDLGSGHDNFRPSVSIEGSGDVFINGKPAMRKGDGYAAHPHNRKLAQGSSTVNINGRRAGRVGDDIDCGGNHLKGSPDVIIGDDSYGSGRGEGKPKFRFLLSQYPGDETFAYRNEKYKLYHNGGLVKEGKSGKDGIIEYEVDELKGDFKVEAVGTVWNMTVQAFSPAETHQGFQQRLAALGYNNHSEKVIQPEIQAQEPISGDVGHFQAVNGETVESDVSGLVKKLIKAVFP